jgi:adenylosuccinate synthase
VLSGIDELKVCVGYTVDGVILDTIPADTSLYARAKPVLKTMPGWSEKLDGIKSANDLPKALMDYIRFIEDETGSKINLISTGAGREAVIDIHRAF